MKAHPGDRIVLAPVVVDGPLRDGEILEAHGPDGGEPFLVRWSDGHTGLYFSGPGAVLRIGPPPSTGRSADAGREAAAPSAPTPTTAPAPAPAPSPSTPHVHDWKVNVSIFSSGDDTDAHVVLVADSPTRLTATGHSHRSPDDPDTPEIGDEVAVARALRHLADRLLGTAAGDIEQLVGEHDVSLRPA